MAEDGLTIDGINCTELGLKPPLVSVIIVNWNYARFVGAAIDSIRGQDYSHFECLVIDNSSTDDSRTVIARQIDGDARFSFLFLDENHGMMGAWLEALDRVKGEFITFLDADDIKFPNFISSHVQVHLAGRLGIGFTSSRVVEIDANDRVINGSNLGFGFNPFDREPRGLKPRETVPRITTVSDADYDILDKCTSWIGPEKSGWYWAPTSANVYRRSVMDLARPDIDACINFIFADVYFSLLCHILGGSAVIDRTLSAYRIHAESASNVFPSMAQMRTSKKRAVANSMLSRQFVLRTLLGRADSLSWIIKDRYWQAINQQSGEIDEALAAYYANPEIQQIFAENLIALILAFGIEVTITEFNPRFPSTESRLVILRYLLSQAPRFAASIYPEIYWNLVDWCGAGFDAGNYLSRPKVKALFVQYCDRMIAAFGRRRTLTELRRRYRIKDWCALIWETRRGWLFPSASLEVRGR